MLGPSVWVKQRCLEGRKNGLCSRRPCEVCIPLGDIVLLTQTAETRTKCSPRSPLDLQDQETTKRKPPNCPLQWIGTLLVQITQWSLTATKGSGL